MLNGPGCQIRGWRLSGAMDCTSQVKESPTGGGYRDDITPWRDLQWHFQARMGQVSLQVLCTICRQPVCRAGNKSQYNP